MEDRICVDWYGSDWNRRFTLEDVMDGKRVERKVKLSDMTGVDLVKSYEQKHPEIDWKGIYKFLGSILKDSDETGIIVTYHCPDLRSFCKCGKVKGLCELTKKKFEEKAEEVDLLRFHQAAIMLQYGEHFRCEYYDPENDVVFWQHAE